MAKFTKLTRLTRLSRSPKQSKKFLQTELSIPIPGRLLRYSALASAAWLMAQSCVAAETLQIPAVSVAPSISDIAHGSGSVPGVAVRDMFQRQPGDGVPASEATEVYLSHDDQNLYVMYVVHYKNRGDMRAHYTKRDEIFGDDAVQLDIDTFRDTQRFYRFWVNPFGVQMDARHVEGQDDDYNFDTQWDSETEATADGFVALMSLPFKSLRFPTGGHQEWGISVGRIVATNNEFSYWPKSSEALGPVGAQMAVASLDIGENRHGGIQWNPYFSLGNSRQLKSTIGQAPLWQYESANRIGADIKWIPDNHASVDLTLRPDFSQVESDTPQATVDKRFEVLYPEKRPFFLENAALFQTPQQIFFSRRILDPQAGARMTAHWGDWNVGTLLMSDNGPGQLLEPTDRHFEQRADVGVVRLQRDFAGGNNLGLLGTWWQLGDQRDRVFSLDSHVVVDENWSINAQWAHSAQEREGQAQGGNLMYAEFKRTDHNFNYSGKLLDISEHFDTTLGFIPRTDIRQISQTANYFRSIDHPWIQSTGPQLNAIVTTDHQGVLQDRSIDLAWIVNAVRGTTFEAHALHGYEAFQGVGFDKQGWQWVLNTSWWSWLDVNVSLNTLPVINYQSPANVTPLLGRSRAWSLDLVFRPESHWRFEELILLNVLRRSQNVPAQVTDQVYRDMQARTTVTYQYDRKLAARMIMDYFRVDSDPAWSTLAAGKTRNLDLQLSYLLYPGTSAYIGYVDQRRNLQLLGQPPVIGSNDTLSLQTGRKAYVKVSYLF